MAKNKKFRKTYLVQIDGTTTNGYAEHQYDELLKNMITVLNLKQKQVDVTISEYEVKENGR